MDSWIGPHILACKKWTPIPQLSKMHISFASMDESCKISAGDISEENKSNNRLFEYLALYQSKINISDDY